MITRRRFLVAAAAALPARVRQRPRRGDSRLQARPGTPTATIAPGEHLLGLGDRRDGILRVPSRYRADAPAPFALLLHGAGGRAQRIVSLLGVADGLGVIVLAPESRGTTWDAVQGEYGADVAFIQRALAFAFERCAIDPRRVAVGGFSDGASYALSLGLDNGDLFTHVLAFSPGFIASRAPQGRPRLFVSHGRHDEILPIASTSRRLVPALESTGYAVKYREFDGAHTVPPDVAHEGFTWFVRA